MITFNYETDFILENEEKLSSWISNIIDLEESELGEINYIFCDDNYLHKINLQFLEHDTFTDIISFDYTQGKVISGDIYISIQRVEENSQKYNVTFEDELNRVIIHGILHYLGYKDKTEEEIQLMRDKENTALMILSI